MHSKKYLGTVYLGINIVSREEVAVKLEPRHDDHLENEIRIYKHLAGGPGIPSVCWFGTEDEYNVMVLERLGPSLDELFSRCNHKFSLKTVLLLSDQLVSLTHLVFTFTRHSERLIYSDHTIRICSFSPFCSP